MYEYISKKSGGDRKRQPCGGLKCTDGCTKTASCVIQLQKIEMKTAKRIWLHKQAADGSEDRDQHKTLPAGTIIQIDDNNVWHRKFGEPGLVYAETADDSGYIKYLPDYVTFVTYDDYAKRQKFRKQRVLKKFDETDAWFFTNCEVHILGRDRLEQNFDSIRWPQEINIELWMHAFELLRTEVWRRLDADLASITGNWEYAEAGAAVQSLELSSADLHREGRLPIFVKFTTGQKMVYKPSSLTIDRQMFGGPGSAASGISTDDHPIPTYQINERSDQDGDYGYMKFLDEQIPVTDTDKLNVFRSIAVNMVMSYLFGYEDIHQENYILLKDRIQLIDMEVVSGVFSPSVLSGWGALLGDLKKKMPGYPDKATVKAAMQTAFNDVYNKASGFKATGNQYDARPALPGLHALTTARVRCVPIATATLYSLLPLVQRYTTHFAWRQAVDERVKVTGGALQIFDMTSNGYLNMVSLRKLLSTLGTYNALREGNIPVYYRNLGEANIIYDEQGARIDLSGDGNTSEKINRTMGQALGHKWSQGSMAANAVMGTRREDNAGAHADAPIFDSNLISRQRLFELFWGKVEKTFYT